MADQPNIVLVHGAWADGSSWSAAIERLQAAGYRVTAPQFALTKLADDVARLRHVLARQDGPTLLVGHSYGGQIVTALGEDAPSAVGLVYIAGFGLDEGESIGGLLEQVPPTPAIAHLDIDDQGFAWLPEDDFLNHFAADVDRTKARVMYAVQQPLHASALEEVMGTPAWKSLPSWFLVAEGDQTIPPDAQRQFAARMGATTTEIGHGLAPGRGRDDDRDRGEGCAGPGLNATAARRQDGDRSGSLPSQSTLAPWIIAKKSRSPWLSAWSSTWWPIVCAASW
jgi:pimeloyl-ACP methyl ester carboxylesterase